MCNSTKKEYCELSAEFVMFDNKSTDVLTDSCLFDFSCPSNCSCNRCVGVCTYDCYSDDTCDSNNFCPSNTTNPCPTDTGA